MMKVRIKTVLLLLLIFGVVYFRQLPFLWNVPAENTEPVASKTLPSAAENEKVVIALVVCGERSEEALVLMKSAVIFQRSRQLEFIILCDFQLQFNLNKELLRMKTLAKDSFSYQMLNLSFPGDRAKEWKGLFKPCAAQRLFLPNILTNVSNILYVDTDVIFLNELSDIWRHVHSMNASQMSALVQEHEDPNVSWYSRFARHPFYGEVGLNSAVMLMNLTKMREFKWVDYMGPILTQFKKNLTWGDQDIINIIFHYHPDKLYVYPCRFNYRPDHCMYKSVCKDAEENGVSVMHGSRGTFHSDTQRSFKAIFEAFKQYEVGSDLQKNLLQPLKRNLAKTSNTNCGSLMNVFLKNPVRVLANVNATSTAPSMSRFS